VLTALLQLVNGNLDSANVSGFGLSIADMDSSVLNRFVKTAPPGTDRTYAQGTFATVGFGGANRQGATIPHGLGVVPSVVMLTASTLLGASTSTGSAEAVCASVTSLDATNITAFVSLMNGATASVGTTIHWIASTSPMTDGEPRRPGHRRRGPRAAVRHRSRARVQSEPPMPRLPTIPPLSLRWGAAPADRNPDPSRSLRTLTVEPMGRCESTLASQQRDTARS
jgi:hypothetical protein